MVSDSSQLTCLLPAVSSPTQPYQLPWIADPGSSHSRPYNANEVFVTGTFDDWGRTVKLDQKGDVFEKEVDIPVTGEKVHYKVCHPLGSRPQPHT